MLEPVLVGPSFKLAPPQQIRLEAVAWIRSRIRILSPTSREVAQVRLSCLEQSHGALPGPLDREALYYTAVHLERCPHPPKQLHQPKHPSSLVLRRAVAAKAHIDPTVPAKAN